LLRDDLLTLDETPLDSIDETPLDSIDETLVAYLDGQLAGEECERVEALLASDAVTRQRLQSLDRVWNALDVLPRATASAAFTRTTVDMAAVSAAASSGVRRRRRPIPWRLLLGLAGGALGALLAAVVITGPQRRALEALPVLLHASALEQVGSLEYLESVADKVGEDLRPFVAATKDGAAEWLRLEVSTPHERQAWAAALAPAEAAELNARVAEHQQRSEAKRASLEALARQIAASPRATQLRETALAYEAMVGRLPASVRSSLRQREEEERLRLVRRDAARWAEEFRLDLDATQRAAFREAVDRLVESSEYQRASENLVGAIRSGFSRRGAESFGDRFAEGMRSVARREPAMLLAGVTMQLAGRGERRGPFERFVSEAGRGAAGDEMRNRLSQAWRGWVEELEEGLPASVVAELDGAEDDAERAQKLMHLLRQAGAAEDLPAAFARLNEEELDRYLLLPADEFRDALSEQVEGGPMGFEGPPGRMGDGRIGDGGRPPFGGRPGFGPPGGTFGPGGEGPPREPPPPPRR
jgi:hypothetical protein